VKVCLSGDMHGNTASVRTHLHKAQEVKADVLIQLGDFGYGWKWNWTMNRDEFTYKVSKAAQAYEIPVWWIDGNHENFDLLESVGAFGADEPVEIEPMVFYVPRGVVLPVGDSNVLFVGGAHSVDKQYRKPHQSWWPQEEITQPEYYRATADGLPKIDVVLTHDVANSGFLGALSLAADQHESMEHLEWKNDRQFPGAKYNRITLEALWQHHLPERWFHGHYHAAYDIQVGPTHFYGLANENERGAYRIETF